MASKSVWQEPDSACDKMMARRADVLCTLTHARLLAFRREDYRMAMPAEHMEWHPDGMHEPLVVELPEVFDDALG